MKVYEWKKSAVEKLKSVCENDAGEADEMLKHVLSCDAAALVMRRREELTDVCEKTLDRLLDKRVTERVPLAYLIGNWTFCGLVFACGKGCLIPRPETEELVGYVLSALPKNGKLLDVCTGSGCIVTTVLHERSDVTAQALDISEDALIYARKNAAACGINDRLTFVKADMKEYETDERYDVIVSNPPYVRTEDMEKLSAEVAREPAIALDGGTDGLDFYRVLAERYGTFLKPGGMLFMEAGYDTACPAAGLFAENGFSDVTVYRDRFGVDRFVSARKGKA